MRKMLIVPWIVCLSAFAGAASAQTAAGDRVQLTLYPVDGDLFTPGRDDGSGGYAIVHEMRRYALAAGTQSLQLRGLAERIDPSGLLLRFAPDSGVRIEALRYAAPVHGAMAALQQAIGQTVQVRSDGGTLLASGTLRAIDGKHLLIEDAQGSLQLVSGNVSLPATLHLARPGQQVSVTLDAPRAGSYAAQLVYPSAGLGWRAGYTLLLRAGSTCAGTLDAQATLANHSGTDFKAAQVTLLAGAIRAPASVAPVADVRMMAAAAPALPKQAGSADYRSYRLSAPLDLADGDVVQVPLYAPQPVSCARNYVWGNVAAPGWMPQQPDFNPTAQEAAQGSPRIEITFAAPQNLPAGEVRTYQPDASGSLQFTGAAGIANLRKDDTVALVPGDAYDLAVVRSRTQWQLEGKVLTEGLRYTLSNTGHAARTVTVYTHPRRWRAWTLLHSVPQPAEHGVDTLMWRVRVPAAGSAEINYTLRYDATGASAPR
jgi:hypothetical protein